MGMYLLLCKVAPTGRFIGVDHRFECDKFVGDREFWAWITHHAIWQTEDERDPLASSYVRPSSFDEAREWVRTTHQPTCNSQRLLDVLDLMEADAALWLYASV